MPPLDKQETQRLATIESTLAQIQTRQKRTEELLAEVTRKLGVAMNAYESGMEGLKEHHTAVLQATIHEQLPGIVQAEMGVIGADLRVMMTETLKQTEKLDKIELSVDKSDVERERRKGMERNQIADLELEKQRLELEKQRLEIDLARAKSAADARRSIADTEVTKLVADTESKVRQLTARKEFVVALIGAVAVLVGSFVAYHLNDPGARTAPPAPMHAAPPP